MDGDKNEAELSVKRLKLDINASVSMSPLLFACAMGNYDMAKCLLNLGADIRAAGDFLMKAI
jgi:ankyrin repeat protein